LPQPALPGVDGHERREGLAQAQTEIPDLIVSDWLMPDMDGVQLCQTLKTMNVPATYR
jgi:CheY-like chemotaxis protein